MGVKTVEVHSDGQPSGEWLIQCPGCKFGHSFNIKPNADNGVGGCKPTWTFNGDVYKPTFRASLLVRYTKRLTEEEHTRIMAGEKVTPVDMVCHSFVTDGKIEFLSDCTHALAGQTVELPDIDWGDEPEEDEGEINVDTFPH